MKVLLFAKGVITLGIILVLSAFTLALPITAFAAPAQTWYENPNVPAGYLAQQDNSGDLIHMIGGDSSGSNFGGINTDYWTTTPGEYCNYYNIGDHLTSTNSNNISSYTGFDPGGARSEWQIGDNYENVCQAKEDTWGFSITGNLNGSCTPPYRLNNVAPCGMHKFVRFSGGQNNKPFSDSYISTNSAGQPALTFDVEAKTQSASGGAAFGYFCPIFQDTANPPYRYVEFCFVEWQKSTGFPDISQYDVAKCANTSPEGNNIDTIFTSFNGLRTMATLKPGSTLTFNLTGPTDYKMYTASITKANMLTALNAILAVCTNHNISTDVKNYALIGFEHGVEGGGFGLLGGSVKDENIYTTTDTLYPGDKLLSGQTLKSSAGGYELTMQGDGNLVMKKNGTPVWWTGTTSMDPVLRYELEVQSSDGNLVVYKVLLSGQRVPTWWTNAAGAGAFATLQSDGNFVHYKKSTQPHWWTGPR